MTAIWFRLNLMILLGCLYKYRQTIGHQLLLKFLRLTNTKFQYGLHITILLLIHLKQNVKIMYILYLVNAPNTLYLSWSVIQFTNNKHLVKAELCSSVPVYQIITGKHYNSHWLPYYNISSFTVLSYSSNHITVISSDWRFNWL